MKIDLYTKIVLTVIALCLVVIVFKSTLQARAAWPDATKVDIVAINGEPVYRAALTVKMAK